MAYLNMVFAGCVDNFEEACLFLGEKYAAIYRPVEKKFQRTVNLQRRLKGGGVYDADK